MMKTDEFRHRLDEATHGYPRKHIERIVALKDIYPHNITLYSNPSVFETDDCFLYVFRDKIPSDLLRKFINLINYNADLFEDICHDLISNGFLSLHDHHRRSDRIVVYFAGDAARHFGRIEDGRIISMWENGYAWKHDLFQVPLSYGDTVMFSNGEIDEDVFRRVIKAHSEPKTKARFESIWFTVLRLVASNFQ